MEASLLALAKSINYFFCSKEEMGTEIKHNNKTWPDPPWPEDGPVDPDCVEPDESVQSKSSEEDWFHPEHNPLSNEHHTKHVKENDKQTNIFIFPPNINFLAKTN